jgi:hypothetical protein
VNSPSELEDWFKQEDFGLDEGFGDDWEAAFQEEDPTLAAGEGLENESFMLLPGSSNPYQFTPPGEADLANLPNLDQEMEKATISRLHALPAMARSEEMADTRNTSWPLFKKSLAALPLVHRLVLGGSILGGLTIMAIFFMASTAPHQPAQWSKQEARISDEPPHGAFPVGTGQPENIRHKWEFKPFYLPVAAADSSEKIIFLEVDLTLLLVLAPDEEMPHAKKIFIRELIYQYFRQQSISTLRHYILARGEMNRNLLAWLREQWPGTSVETVIFTRYQLG